MRSSPEYIFHLLGIWPTQKNRRLSLFAWQRWRLGAAVWDSTALRWQHSSLGGKQTSTNIQDFLFIPHFFFLSVFHWLVGVTESMPNMHVIITFTRLWEMNEDFLFSSALACFD